MRIRRAVGVLTVGVLLWTLRLAGSGTSRSSEQEARIAFLRLTSLHWQVWLMAPDGSDQVQLTHSPVDKVHMAGRPGTAEVVYHTNRGETFVRDLKTGSERRILEDIPTRTASWSPDGRLLVYAAEPEVGGGSRGRIWISAEDGTQRQEVAEGVDFIAAPLWLGEKAVLYVHISQLRSFELSHEFYERKLGDGAPPRLVAGDDEAKKLDPAVFLGKQGSVLAYSSLRSGFYEIWTQRLAGGEPRQRTRLEAYAGNPSWSPDGAALAFDSNATGGTVQIFRMDADGNGLLQLTRTEAGCRKPVWLVVDGESMPE